MNNLYYNRFGSDRELMLIFKDSILFIALFTVYLEFSRAILFLHESFCILVPCITHTYLEA